MSAESDDTTLEQNSSTLVFGIMGVGTFILLFMTALVLVVWLFTLPFTMISKIMLRAISLIIFGIIVLILVFAERESKFRNESSAIEV
jgi:hypothetical protein